MVVAETYWAGFIEKGFEFRVWDGRNIMYAKVTKVFLNNWSEVDFKNRWITITYDELKDIINNDLKNALLINWKFGKNTRLIL